MKRALGVAGVSVVLSLGFGGIAHAEPPVPNEHNCAGVATSAGAGPEFGEAISGVARLFPAAIPTLFDFANCGDNGQGL